MNLEQQYFDYKSSQRKTYLNKKNQKQENIKHLVKQEVSNIHSIILRKEIKDEDSFIEEYLNDQVKKGKLKSFHPYNYKHYNKNCGCDQCGQIYNKEHNKYKFRNYLCNGTLVNPVRIEKIYEHTTL